MLKKYSFVESKLKEKFPFYDLSSCTPRTIECFFFSFPFLSSVTETVKNVTSVKHMIDAEYFKHILVTFGDKMTQEEIDDMFDEFDFDDDGFIMTKSVVRMFVSRA